MFFVAVLLVFASCALDVDKAWVSMGFFSGSCMKDIDYFDPKFIGVCYTSGANGYTYECESDGTRHKWDDAVCKGSIIESTPMTAIEDQNFCTTDIQGTARDYQCGKPMDMVVGFDTVLDCASNPFNVKLEVPSHTYHGPADNPNCAYGYCKFYYNNVTKKVMFETWDSGCTSLVRATALDPFVCGDVSAHAGDDCYSAYGLTTNYVFPQVYGMPEEPGCTVTCEHSGVCQGDTCDCTATIYSGNLCADCDCTHGTCGASDTQCECPAIYSGVKCADCKCTHGSCGVSDTQCDCSSTIYSGTLCADCDCAHGTCGASETQCECPAIYTGAKCADCDCTHGTCGASETQCECPAIYTGIKCDTCKCEHGGTCGSGDECENCPLVYEGALCNVCKCKNGGNCTKTPEVSRRSEYSYYCDCGEGFDSEDLLCTGDDASAGFLIKVSLFALLLLFF